MISLVFSVGWPGAAYAVVLIGVALRELKRWGSEIKL